MTFHFAKFGEEARVPWEFPSPLSQDGFFPSLFPFDLPRAPVCRPY